MARLSIRIDFGPDQRIGPGKIQLLEHIAALGSIAAGGRALGMSYRRAWELIDELKTRYAIVIVFIIAAVLTPPDMISQISLAVPALLLYELSIISVGMVEKKRAAKAAEESTDIAET